MTENNDRLTAHVERRVSMIAPKSGAICPECRVGKCRACDGRALSHQDEIVECSCGHPASER